jgi:type VI secretion system secreted protein VgrG
MSEPSRAFRLSVEGIAPSWAVLRLEGHERIHHPFSFEVTCGRHTRDESPLDLEALLGRRAVLTWPTDDGSERRVAGVLRRVEAVHDGYRFAIVPRVSELGEGVDHRVFLGVDAVAIAEEVLGAEHVSIERRLSRPLPARAQCVQLFESGLGFVSRLLAEEGIAWWLRPGDEETVVLSDHPTGYDDVAGGPALRVAEDAGLFGAPTATRVRLRASVTSDKVAMRDYDFAHPGADLGAEAAEGDGRLEVFAYPGGYADPSTGAALARVRLEEARMTRLVLEAESSCRRLAAGHVLALTGGARDEINQRWLLVDVRHTLDRAPSEGAAPRYVARFTAVPASAGYRPPRVGRPRPRGPQTATITGPMGTEIHTETHGRTTAALRWDRRPAKDERSSSWMRVAQPATSGGLFLPRVGWEAVLGFSGTSADAPFVLGRLDNGAALPAEPLPAHKVVGAFGSLTTPNGGSANTLRLDDAAGGESFGLAASADYNERTENDKATGITGADAYAIGGSRKLIVGTAHDVSVSGAQSYTISAGREVNVDADKSITAASESVSIGGARVCTIGGDLTTVCALLTRLVGAAKAEAPIEHQTRSVTGASAVTVGAAWNVTAGPHASVSVLGASVEEVGGAKNVLCGEYKLAVSGALTEALASRSIKAGGERGEQFGAAASYAIGGSAKLSGSDVVFKAKGRIKIKAGGATITLTPGAITIDGEFSGSVASVDDGSESYG